MSVGHKERVLTANAANANPLAGHNAVTPLASSTNASPSRESP